MDRLFTKIRIGGIELQNRICVPPMVCFKWGDDTGYVTPKNIEHYRAIAAGGPGLIIQEATCVRRDGRLSSDQLGIWEDAQVDGLRSIVDAVHEHNVPIFIQIHHAGIMGIDEHPVCPSDYTLTKPNGEVKVGRALLHEEIQQITADFIEAGRRAIAAGYDGVEIHGCHSYLISQFLNSNVNSRADEYGAHPEILVRDIYDGIRAIAPKNFVIGIRLGGFEPTINVATKNAKAMELIGLDFLNISYGFSAEQNISIPKNYAFRDIIYAAHHIKNATGIPVFAVNGINSVRLAQDVLENTRCDMVNIGRGVLVNYNWANDAKDGRDVGRCLYCPTCVWRTGTGVCPGKSLLERSTQS